MACSGGGEPGGGPSSPPLEVESAGGPEDPKVSITTSPNAPKEATLVERVDNYATLVGVTATAEFKAEITNTLTAQAYDANAFSAELAADLLEKDYNLSATSQQGSSLSAVVSLFVPLYAYQGVTMVDGSAFDWTAALSGDSTLSADIEGSRDRILTGFESVFQILTAGSRMQTNYVRDALSIFWNQVELVSPEEIDLSVVLPGIDISRLDIKIRKALEQFFAANTIKIDGVLYNYYTWRPSVTDEVRLVEEEAVDTEGSGFRINTNVSAQGAQGVEIKILPIAENTLFSESFLMEPSHIDRFLTYLRLSGANRLLNFSAIGEWGGIVIHGSNSSLELLDDDTGGTLNLLP